MENKKETIDIVKLIEKDPITRLSKNSQDKFINKIKSEFTESQQHLFVASFICYLKYDAKDDFVIDFDNTWKWLGFARKDSAKRLLEKYFVETKDYKIILHQSVENSTGRPEEQILMTVNTFKKFCLKANTKKSDEIHDYYIKLENLLQQTIDEETTYLKAQIEKKDLQLLQKDKQQQYQVKKERHRTLVELLKTKKCVYVAEIKENELIKIGSSKNVDGRILGLSNDYDYDNDVIYLEIFECIEFRDIERKILDDPKIKKNITKKIIKKDGTSSFEVVELSKEFSYEHLIKIIKHYVGMENNTIFTSEQRMDKYKLDMGMTLESQKLFIEKQKLLNEKQKMDDELLKKMMENDSFKDLAKKIIEDRFANSKQEMENNEIDVLELKNDKIISKTEDNVTENKLTKILNPDNNVLMDYNLHRLKPQGRKIQKIDPNDSTKIIKVYDSMIYLLRSPENDGMNKCSLTTAIKKNMEYKGYRWNFVEYGEDENVAKIKPTEKKENKAFNESILRLNETKTKIIESFSTKSEVLKKFNLYPLKFDNIMKDNELHDNSYFISYSNCPKDLLDEYDKSAIRTIKSGNKYGCVKRIDPITKIETIFRSSDEVYKKLGFKSKTIKKAIENKNMYGGCLWEFC